MKIDLEKLPYHAKARNPNLFDDRGRLARLPGAEPQRLPRMALDKAERRAQEGASGTPKGTSCRVTIIASRKRLLDGDNLVGGMKPLRDEIARSLGIDDAERFVEWEYHQVKTNGAPGVFLRIDWRVEA